MTRRERDRTWFLRVVFVIGAVASIASAVRAEDGDAGQKDLRPNIILIMADDVGYECFGCYGSRQYQTPHIDRLARGGMRFTHCYSQPLCTPSRIKIMTGLSNARNYSAFSVLNRDQRTIGHRFQAAGYETLIAGKWQLLGAEHYAERFRQRGTWPRDAGFDHVCLWQVDRLGSRFWGPLLYIDGKNRQFDENEYGPDVATKYITDFMATGRDKPFFVYYPMILVHSPFVPTPGSESRENRSRQRNFEDMVRHMDTLIGRIVETTEELGIADRTLILFTGDNGTHGSIRSTLEDGVVQGGKGKTTDAGTRVPLVAYWPGVVPEGRVSEDLVDFSDFMPTLLEASGTAPPEHLDGQSFLPQLRGEVGNPREWIYCYYCPRPERTRPVRFIRDQRWKLYGDGRFLDVESDPLEREPQEDVDRDTTAGAARDKLQAALQSMPTKGRTLLKFGPSFP